MAALVIEICVRSQPTQVWTPPKESGHSTSQSGDTVEHVCGTRLNRHT